MVEGTQSVGAPGYTEGVPAYKQFYVETDADTTAVRLTWKLSSGPGGGGGSPFGGGQAQLFPLDVSLRLGEPVKVSYANGSMTLEEDARFSTELIDNEQSVVLTGDCLVSEGGKPISSSEQGSGQSGHFIDEHRASRRSSKQRIDHQLCQSACASRWSTCASRWSTCTSRWSTAPAGGQPAMAGNGG